MDTVFPRITSMFQDRNNMPEEQKIAENIIDKALDVATGVRHKAQNTAQEVLSKAEMKAKELIVAANEQPSNRELLRTVEAQNRQFAEHAKEDILQFAAIHDHMENIATKEDIKELTKKIEPVLEIYRAVLLSKGFVTGIAGVVIAITAIGIGFTWLINAVITKH